MTISSLLTNKKIQDFLEILENYSSRIIRERDLIKKTSEKSDKKKLKEIQKKLKESQEKFLLLTQDKEVDLFISLCYKKVNPSGYIKGIIGSLSIIKEYQNKTNASMSLENSTDDLSGAAYGNVRSEAFRAEPASGISLPAGIDNYEDYTKDPLLKDYSPTAEQAKIQKTGRKIFVPDSVLKHIDIKEQIMDYLDKHSCTSFLTEDGKYGVRICIAPFADERAYDPQITDPKIVRLNRSLEFFTIHPDSKKPEIIDQDLEKTAELAQKIVEEIFKKELQPLGNSTDDLSSAAYGNLRSEAFRSQPTSGISLPSGIDDYEDYMKNQLTKDYSTTIEQSKFSKTEDKIFFPNSVAEHIDIKEQIMDYLDKHSCTSFLTEDGKYGVRICIAPFADERAYDPQITDPKIVRLNRSLEFFTIHPDSKKPEIIDQDLEKTAELAQKIIEEIVKKEPQFFDKKTIIYPKAIRKFLEVFSRAI